MENLDHTDWLLLAELQRNARLTFADLGRRLKMSPPAVAERVHKLETQGVISGYHAKLNLAAIGFKVVVFIRVKVPQAVYTRFKNWTTTHSSVLEVHHIAGAESFLLKAAVPDVSDLEAFIGALSQFGETNTVLVLSSPFEVRVLEEPGQGIAAQ